MSHDLVLVSHDLLRVMDVQIIIYIRLRFFSSCFVAEKEVIYTLWVWLWVWLVLLVVQRYVSSGIGEKEGEMGGEEEEEEPMLLGRWTRPP